MSGVGSSPNTRHSLQILPWLDALSTPRNKQIKDHPVFIRRIESSKQAKSCQVLFVGYPEHRSMKEIYEQTGTTPVLLVAEEGAYDVQNVIIILSEQQSKISFRINRTEAAK